MLRAPRFIVKALLAVLGGCISHNATDMPQPEPPAMEALYTQEPILLDGKLDDPIWQNAKPYPLQLAPRAPSNFRLHNPNLIAGNPQPLEGGIVRLAWNEQFLYVGVSFTDSDIVAEGTHDQMRHYLLGDTAEVFLKPTDQTWFWEMYATPAGHKTIYFFPGGGRDFWSTLTDYKANLEIASHIEGTLNQWQDRDGGWSAEFAIPWADFNANEQVLSPQTPLSILVARYNFSRYLSSTELSSAPRLPYLDFKLTDAYARLTGRCKTP